MSILTYLIVFAEAMVASLFWALSFAWPEGKGLSSSISSRGWMLYLQVVFTPILMLGGFFIGIQLVYIMGWWVDSTLFSTLSDAYSGDSRLYFGVGSNLGVLGAIGMLIVYTGLMLAIVWKSFDMTAELKNWVFEWIGGSPRSMGENDAQSKHIMGVAAGGSKGVATAATAGGNKGNEQPGGGGGDTPKPKGGGTESNAEPKPDPKGAL